MIADTVDKLPDSSLRVRLARVARRLMLVGATGGLLWGLIGVLAVLIIGGWVDLLWGLGPRMRISVWTISTAGGGLVLGVLVRSTAIAARASSIAKRLDATAATGGDILTGLDLDEPGAGVQVDRTAELTNGLARLAVDHAARLALEVPVGRAVTAKPVHRSLAVLAIAAAAVGILVACLPRLAWTEWSRFTDPFGNVPPFSWTQFEVTPGDTEVLYGSPREIGVTATGRPVEQVELVIVDTRRREESLPMFEESDGSWRAVLSRVTEPATYYVRSFRSQSRRYGIRVKTVPLIEEVRVRITPPDYTRLAAYEGPVPGEGVSGLPGTKVEIRARSNRPLSGGRLSFVEAGSSAVADGQTRIELTATAQGSDEVLGVFQIHAAGKFQLKVTDVAGQPSLESFSAAVVLLTDQRPFVRLTQPKPVSLATPSTVLPVVISAEDDYGISRLELFRSLNDSRALPTDVRLAADAPPRRVYESVHLPLNEYGLEPGDVIRMFARVTDNHPAGEKGAESSVVEVRIISQEEFERMLRVREGINVLLSKYREAQRRMEQLTEELESLRKKLEAALPDDPVSAELREELGRMLMRLRKESKELRRLAGHDLPFDLDKHLSPLVDEMASGVEDIQRQLEELSGDPELGAGSLAKQLQKMLDELGGSRKDFQQQATVPLDVLEVVMPLIADEAKFIQLTMKQMDLADRLASLEGHDGEDKPALKARMRDLEEEQQTIRKDLGDLMEDILDHVETLPDDPEFELLRKSAQKFVRDVESSGATEAMVEAEQALVEFSGSRAYEKARQAAEILKSFIAVCQSEGGVGNQGRRCLGFQPRLAQGLGNSVDQLLEAMGLGAGRGGVGGGTGGQGGYSAVRGPGQNIGLYGSMPGITPGAAAGQTGQAAFGDDGRSGSGGLFSNPNVDTWVDTLGEDGAGGSGEGAVPVRYRRRVSKYFQRLAEQISD